MDDSAQQVLSWMTRSRPGIKWRTPARAVKSGPEFGLTSFQPHNSSRRKS
jgi:hypothetical protein